MSPTILNVQVEPVHPQVPPAICNGQAWPVKLRLSRATANVRQPQVPWIARFAPVIASAEVTSPVQVAPDAWT